MRCGILKVRFEALKKDLRNDLRNDLSNDFVVLQHECQAIRLGLKNKHKLSCLLRTSIFVMAFLASF
jgi:hypothetical protein